MLVVMQLGLLAWTPAWAFKGLKHVKVELQALEDPTALCADFQLTAAQAKQALKDSRVITREAFLNEYVYLPCKVSGTARLGSQTVRWELHAGGNGRLVHADGREMFLGCRPCEARFGSNKP